jgi:hypothetical protein
MLLTIEGDPPPFLGKQETTMAPQLKPGNEQKPDWTGLSPNFWLRQGGIPYKPGDYPKQEDWGTVARKFGVGVRERSFSTA